MSFDLHSLVDWMRAADVPFRIGRADGAELGALPDEDLVRVEFDSRLVGPDALFCGVPGEHVHGAAFLPQALAAGVRVAVVEGEAPAVPDSPAVVLEVEDARQALNAAARGWLDRHAPRVVGVTGSNGKTTTKDFTAAALRGSVAAAASPGNRNSGWGLPAAVLGFSGDEEVLVLEMGASAPDEIGRLAAVARPWMGCITNIAGAHIEFFGSLDEVARTKGQLIEALPSDGVAVLNRDCPRYASLVARTRARVVDFGFSAEATVRIESARAVEDGVEVVIAGHRAVLGVFGTVNAANAAAAMIMAEQLGVDPGRALERMAAAAMSPHRSRRLRVGGRQVVDDCYNANPASVLAALDALAAQEGAGRRFVLLGDMAELGDHAAAGHREVIARALRDDALHRVLVAGPLMREAAASFDDPRLLAHAEVDAVALSRQLVDETEEGDVILLKASRSSALERVLEALETELDEGDAARGGRS